MRSPDGASTVVITRRGVILPAHAEIHILGIFIPMHLQDILQSLEKNSQD